MPPIATALLAAMAMIELFAEGLADSAGRFGRNQPPGVSFRLMQVAGGGFLFQRGSRPGFTGGSRCL